MRMSCHYSLLLLLLLLVLASHLVSFSFFRSFPKHCSYEAIIALLAERGLDSVKSPLSTERERLSSVPVKYTSSSVKGMWIFFFA